MRCWEVRIENQRSSSRSATLALLIFLLAIPAAAVAQFNPTASTSLDNQQAGAMSGFSQDLLFPSGSEGPSSLLVQFDRGSFDFTGFVPQQPVGGAVIDVFIQSPIVTIAGQIIAEVQILSITPDMLEAIAMVTEITGNVTAGLALLGFPDPTGQVAFNVLFTDLPGDEGATMSVIDSGILPLSGILDFDVPLVWVTEPILFHSPAGGVLTVDTLLTSTTGVTVTFEETFPLADSLGEDFQRGDCNTDGSFNIADAVFTLDSLFSGGQTGSCADACDSNDDGSVNIADAIYSLAALFSGGPQPDNPSPGSCGPDPSISDPLDCEIYDAC